MNRIKKAWDVLVGRKEDPLEGMTTAVLSADLMRKMLGSMVSLDVKNRPTMTETERKHYEQTVAAFFPHVIEPTINRLVYAQEQLMARGTEELRRMVGGPVDQILFGRGTINGLVLVLEEFQEAFDAHIAEVTKKGEKFDPRKLFPELFDEEETKTE